MEDREHDVQFVREMEQVRQGGVQDWQVLLMGIIVREGQLLTQVLLDSTRPLTQDVHVVVDDEHVAQLVLHRSHTLVLVLATLMLTGHAVPHTPLYR